MQEEYMKAYIQWPNKRIGIDGTLQRPPYSLAMGQEWVRALDSKKGQDEVFAILLHDDTGKERRYRYVGHTGLHRIHFPDAWASTGSVIGDPKGREGGTGTEAKLLLQKHAFKVLGVRKLVSNVKGWNAPSLGHLIKCGYKIVGRYSKHIFHEGTFVDEILLECFREDWEPIWQKYEETKTLPKLTAKQRALVSKQTTHND